jgi:basic membrane protein A
MAPAATEVPTEVPAAEPEFAVKELIPCDQYDLSALRIGLVTDVGEVDDKSFNQSTWEGVLAAELCGALVNYIQTASAADYADNIAEFAENEYDIIVTVGFALGPATLEAAALYPEVLFIGVDQFQVEPLANVAGLVFHEDQSGYLAGVLAGRLTQTGTIAAVLGTDQVPPVVAFKEGYEAGARAVNPDIRIISTYHPGAIDQAFTDPEWGASTAKQALDQDADVVFGAGGKTGNGALIEVANAVGPQGPPPFCIGVDTDQWFTVPEAHPCLVSSAMKLLDKGVAAIIMAHVDGTLEPGNFFGEAGLADFHDLADFVPDEVKAELEEVAAGLLDGSISTGYGVAAAEPAAEGPQDLLAVALADGRFMTLGLAVDMGGLSEALGAEGPFTIFSPTDEAFGLVPAGVVDGLMADPEVLVATLKYHVVPGKLMAADVAGMETLTTLEGTAITVEVDAEGNVILNGTVKIIAADIEATNGVLHALDGVLLLPGMEALAAEATPTPEPAAIGVGADLGVVKIGMNAEYPPFEFVDEAGNIVGFDPDLVAEIARRAGFEYELVNTRWDGIFVALAAGEFDMVASAATITAEREEIVDFSNPYFYANQRIAVLEARAEEIQGIEDLAGLRVAVQAGTTGDIFASENIPGVEMLRYDEITLAFQALAAGDADAIVNDGPTSADIIAKNPELGVVLVGPPLSEEYYGIAVQPDRPELLDAVNKALAEIIADGTYQELFLKWFGVNPPDMFLPQE